MQTKKKIKPVLLAAIVFAVLCMTASGRTVLWHHFDERAPGETAQAGDVFVNSASDDYGSGTAYSIGTGNTLGTDSAFMPKFASTISAAPDIIYDPISGSVHTNRAAASFRTEGTAGSLSGGAVVIEDSAEFRLTDYTVECFVCSTSTTFNLIAPIVGKIYGGAFTSESWQLGMLTNGKVFIRYNRQPSNTQGAGTHMINDGLWHHLALVCSYDAEEGKSVFRVYVDYEFDFQASRAGTTAYGTVAGINDIYVGGYQYDGRRFDGQIDELRITDAALTEDQFLRRRPPFGDGDALVWLPLDGTSGAQISGSLNAGCGPQAKIITVGNGVTAPVYSAETVSDTLRTDVTRAPFVENGTSALFTTNGTANSGACIHLPNYRYVETNLTAELFFRTAGKITTGTSQTLLKISDLPILQLTLDNTKPGMFIVVYSNITNANLSSKWTSFNVGANLDDGNWHHAALVYDAENQTLKVYIDYQHMKTENNVKLSTVPAVAAIGATPWGYIQHFHGWIDSVRFTQKVLEPSEFLNASSRVYDEAENTVFHFAMDGDYEAFAGGQAIMGIGYPHGDDDAAPAFASEVRHAELLQDGEGGSNVHTNEGSAYMAGSTIHFPNVPGQGAFDQTAEFFCRLTSIPYLAGLLRVNAKANGMDIGDPVWALYGEMTYIQFRCSTVTNGVVSVDRYLATTVTKASLCDDKWHHVGVTFQQVDAGENTQITLYIDGEQKWQAKLTGTLYTYDSNAVAIGAASQHADGAITGYIDEVRITKGVLPPSRFLCRYRRPRGAVISLR